MNVFKKAVETPVNTRQEVQTNVEVNGLDLTYTLCDRTDLNSELSNYFLSFNLPYNSDNLPVDSVLSTTYPEVQQLNVDRIVITPIDRSKYHEIIDGRSITLKVPQDDGVGGLSAKTLISSTYNILEKTDTNNLLGSNVAFLFCDEINLPYTGSTDNGTNNSRANINTWDYGDSFVERPAAVSYIDLQSDDINTDQRPFSGVNQAVSVGESYPGTSNQGYNYDIPVGFAALDKGWFVYTHPEIVNNIPWTGGTDSSGNPNTSGATEGIYFTDTTISNSNFVDIDVEYKTSIIALVFPTEFFFSTNPSWDHAKNYQEQQSGTFGYDPVSISEIALYNMKGEIIAISKLDRPLVKQYNDLVTFNLDINL
jgi:hypothetical protein